jgi:hypothetical protein
MITLDKILINNRLLIRAYNKFRSKGKSFRTINDRELALITDMIKDLKRLMFIYGREQDKSEMQTTD